MHTPQHAAFRVGFQSSREELSDVPLRWRGDPLPDWLRGTLIRNGPGLYELGNEPYHHWFDGLGMMVRFAFDDRGVRYSNRFLQSPNYVEGVREQRVMYSEFSTNPQRGVLARLDAFAHPRGQFGLNNSVNIIRRDGSWLAVGDEPWMTRIDPNTLDTLTVERLQGDDAGLMIQTPHPARDDARGEWIEVGIGVSLRGFGYQAFRVRDGTGRRERIATIPRSRPTYLHSFGLSDRFIIITEHPYLPNDIRLATVSLTNTPMADVFRWEPEHGTTFFVIDRVSGRVVCEATTDPMLVFHHVNAVDREGVIWLDVCSYPSATIIDQLYVDYLRGPDGAVSEPSQLTRVRIDTNTGEVTTRLLAEDMVEMPRIADRMCSRAYDWVYGTSMRRDAPPDFINQLVKVGVRAGSCTPWFEPGTYPTEPLFVARPGATSEDDGVVLSVVVDGREPGSFLLALDAATFEEIGRARVPHVIPFGFHGCYAA